MHCKLAISTWISILLLQLTTKCCKAQSEETSLMEKSVSDIFEDSTSEGEYRSITFDRFGSFNTSLAFFVPVFLWKLPGVDDAVAAGDGGKYIGILGTMLLVMVAGLSIAIHTMTNGGISNENISPDDAEGARNFGGDGYLGDGIVNLVHRSIESFPEVLDLRSCVKFSICEAHTNPTQYGLLAWTVRLLVPAKVGLDGKEMSDFEQAAIYGLEQKDDCHYEYPCLIQSLIDAAIYGSSLFHSSQY